MQRARECVPELYPFIEWAYGAPSALRPVGAPQLAQPLSSQAGVKQGDPLGPLLFAMAFQPVLQRAQGASPEAAILAYLDDVTIAGTPSEVRAAFEAIRSDASDTLKDVGLAVNEQKCGIYARDEEAARRLAGQIGVPHRADGLTVLGTPIGKDEHVRTVVTSKAEETIRLIERLMDLEVSIQVKFALLRMSLSVRMRHFQRTVEWQHVAEPTQRVDRGIVDAAAMLFDVAPTGDEQEEHERARRQLSLPIRHAGFGLRTSTELGAHAAHLSGAALAARALETAPQHVQPFRGEDRERSMQTRWEALFSAFGTQCQWTEDMKEVTAAAVRKELPMVESKVGRILADADGARFLESARSDRERARIRSAAGVPAGAWLTALPTGPDHTLADVEFANGGRHRLGLGVRTTMPPAPCRCERGGGATADHPMFCSRLQGTNTMRHDKIADAVRRVVNRAGCPANLEPLYSRLHDRAGRAGPEGQRRGDVFAILSDGSALVVDVTVAHPAAPTYAAAAAKESGAIAARRERDKRREWQAFADGAKYNFVPFGVETYGYLGRSALQFLGAVSQAAASTGKVSRALFMTQALQTVSCALVKLNNALYMRSLFQVVREVSDSFSPGLEVPVDEVA